MTIKFDKNVYTFRAVSAAAGAFAGLAVFRIRDAGKNMLVEITGGKTEADKNEIRDEFANYVLFLMNK